VFITNTGPPGGATVSSAHFHRKILWLQVLRAHGVRVLTVREILAFGVDEGMGARVELEELAATTLTYRLAEGTLLTVLFQYRQGLPTVPSYFSMHGCCITNLLAIC
jgi:hypothetical protein